MELKRPIEEIIEMYKLEPELKDVYVEGITDQLIIDRFISKYGIDDVKVVEVNDIDFTSIYDEFNDIKCNNKGKLLALGNILERYFGIDLNGITIIVDKDYDEIKDQLCKSHYVMYTDYNSLELYLFNSNVIDIFYKHVLRRFPIDGEFTIQHVGPILIEKFLIRLALDDKGPFDADKITDLSKTVVINKKTYDIEFDPLLHLRKILNNLKLTNKMNEFLAIIETYRAKLNTDLRNNIRGHDFIHLFFTYIDKIKNNIGLSEDTLERSLFQCIDYSELRKNRLFVGLETKYKQQL